MASPKKVAQSRDDPNAWKIQYPANLVLDPRGNQYRFTVVNRNPCGTDFDELLDLGIIDEFSFSGKYSPETKIECNKVVIDLGKRVKCIQRKDQDGKTSLRCLDY